MLTIIWAKEALAKLAIFCGILGNLFAAASEIDVEYWMFGAGRFLPPLRASSQRSTLLWSPAPYAYQFVALKRLNVLEPGTPEILLQLLGRRALRDVRRACLWPKLPVPLKNLPPFLGTKIHIIDIKFATRSQDAKRFFHVIVAIPLLQMHEDGRAINKINGNIGNWF